MLDYLRQCHRPQTSRFAQQEQPGDGRICVRCNPLQLLPDGLGQDITDGFKEVRFDSLLEDTLTFVFLGFGQNSAPLIEMP